MQKASNGRLELLRQYRERPDFYAMHKLGHLTWSKQREILLSVANNPRTAVRASHGVGKTFTAAEIVVWFLDCFPNSKVITTAPTWRQVRDLLWSEIGRIYQNSRYVLSGECLQMAIKTESAEHFAIGFSADNAQSAEGYHAPAILYVFDEAKGIPPWMWESARGAMTGGFCRWLVISTTDGVNIGEPYYNVFEADKENKWNKIHISALDSPFLTGEKFCGIDIPEVTKPAKYNIKRIPAEELADKVQMASRQYIDDSRADWGEDSILYMTKVLGRIVSEAPDSVIKLADIIKMFRNYECNEFSDEGAVEIGVDVARFGDDDSVIVKRKGMKVKAIENYHGMDTQALAEKVEIAADFDKTVRIKIDDTGVGGGVTDTLRKKGYKVIPINFGAMASNTDKFPDIVSEMWFELAAIIKDIACPENKRLESELANRKHKGLDKKGRRQIESKKEYKARGFRSPDIADALLLAFYNPKNIEVNKGIGAFAIEEKIKL